MHIAPHLNYNSQKNLFVIHEAGFVYQIPPELIDDLKNVYNTRHSVESWYDDLEKLAKQRVVRSPIEINLFLNDSGFMMQ